MWGLNNLMNRAHQIKIIGIRFNSSKKFNNKFDVPMGRVVERERERELTLLSS